MARNTTRKYAINELNISNRYNFIGPGGGVFKLKTFLLHSYVCLCL